jgi:TRAP-type C4-dicarboxylate transport system permease small subunit
MISFFNKLRNVFSFIIAKLLFLGIIIILLLGLSGILLRWQGLSPMWIDPLMRHLVLIIAFLGATLATEKSLHIKIDVFATFLEKFPNSIKKYLYLWIQAFTFIISFFLTYASYQFFLIEKEYPQPSIFDLESYHLVFIIPLGFFLVTFMTFLKLFDLKHLEKNEGVND